ncbi:MAG TPA: hypothetical protein DEQ52_01000 [Ruminococcaceae bacterium]|nr:hypothetical protein [Oscillospiraceae bacterium]
MCVRSILKNCVVTLYSEIFPAVMPEAVKRYSLIKEKAAALFPNDIDGYIEYKSPCIEELYEQCVLKVNSRF